MLQSIFRVPCSIVLSPTWVIDFIALPELISTICGPVMRAFPIAKRLFMNLFHNDYEISFVYFGSASTTPGAMMSAPSETKLIAPYLQLQFAF